MQSIKNCSYKSFHESERAFGILASFFSEGENLISYDLLVSILKVIFFLKKSCHSNNPLPQGISLSTENAAYEQAHSYATWKAREKHQYTYWKRLTKW